MMYPQTRKERPRRLRVCSAAWCTKTSEESPFFWFPTNDLRAKQWDTALVYKNHYRCRRALCRDHFEDKCFGSTLKTKLLSTAIPTRQVKVKEEKISDDETSKSPFSELKIHTNSGTENKRSPYRTIREKKTLKRKCDIEKTLDEYLQKRHLVYNKLQMLKEETAKRPPPKQTNYKFPVNLSKQKKNHSYTVTVTKVGGDVRNSVAPNKNLSKSNKSKKQKTNDAEEIKKLSEYDLNLMSCCLMKSIDERAELENDAIDDSKLEGFVIQVPKQSENKVKRLESDALKSGAENHLSKTSNKRTENDVIAIVKTGSNSSKASSLIESRVKTEKEDVPNSSKSMRTEGNVCKVVKGTENSSKSTSVSTENDVFMPAKRIEYLSKISSTVTESSASNSAKEKVENSSMLLSIQPENGREIVKEGGTNHELETSKLSRIESKDVSTSEISDEFENYMSDKSNSNRSALELQSESDVSVKEHVSNTARKAVENSPKTSSNVKEHLSGTAIKCIEKNLLTPSRSENSVFHTSKERIENGISAASDTSKTESKDVCVLEISEDYGSFGANVAERLKKLHDPFVRIEALLRIQQVLLEAESKIRHDLFKKY